MKDTYGEDKALNFLLIMAI